MTARQPLNTDKQPNHRSSRARPAAPRTSGKHPVKTINPSPSTESKSHAAKIDAGRTNIGLKHPSQPSAQRQTAQYDSHRQSEAGFEDFSASDDPVKRKNPELYSSIQVSTADPAVSYVVNTSAQSRKSPSSDSSSQPIGSTTNAERDSKLTSTRSSEHQLHKPEVLAPAGGWPQLQAAVENGADAVYFGLSDFSARARASNFEPDDLPAIMTYLHDRGVKGFVALNVLVFDEELPKVEDRIRQMAKAGVDAVIVQDLGVVHLMRRVAPHLPVHGSTQMSITSPEGAEFVTDMGVERVVVGRELSIREIQQVRQGTEAEVEAFVHGALCVSYSGQCFSSEAWGGRSANRGQCAQACRMPYGLLVDGTIRELGDVKYLLSPQDLMAVELVPELIQAGVSCFKIEGRLKGPEYVALTTRIYRKAVDAAWTALTAATSHMPAEQDMPLAAPACHHSVSAASSVNYQSASPASSSSTTHDSPAHSNSHSHSSSGAFTPGRTADSAAGGMHGQVTSSSTYLNNTQSQMISSDTAKSSSGPTIISSSLSASVGSTGSYSAAETELHVPLSSALQTAKQAVKLSQSEQWDLEQVFARGQDAEHTGLTPGFLDGVKHQRLVRGRVPRHRGVYLGKVVKITTRGVVLELQAPIRRGDGVVFDAGNPEAQEEGGSVYDVLNSKGLPIMAAADEAEAGANSGWSPQTVQLVFGSGQVNLDRVKVGDIVWRTKDSTLESRVRSSFASLSSSEMRKVPIHVTVAGALGEPLVLQLRDPEGRVAVASTAVALSAASKRPLGPEEVMKALGQLGDNVLTIGNLDMSGLQLHQGLFLPASELKAVRRSAAEQLMALRRQHNRAQDLVPQPVLPELLSSISARSQQNGQQASNLSQASKHSPSSQSQTSNTKHQQFNLRLLCRSKAQVQAAVMVEWLDEIILDFLEVQGLKEAVAQVKAAGKRAVVATPRILKPDEERLWLFYLKLGADALLLRSAGFLHQLMKMGGPGASVANVPYPIPRLEGDFSLNAANVLTADLLLRSGLDRLTPTHDLNAAQMSQLARGLGMRASQLEVILHQHLPIFHTEHCVFCRFLSSGNSYKDCGHPCEKHTVHLRDQQGQDHLVLADMGCRNTVFNAQAQSGLYFLPELQKAGVGSFRVELVDEPAGFVADLLEGYRAVAMKQQPTREVWQWMQTLPDANGHVHGVASGSLAVHKERQMEFMKPTAAALKW